MGGGFSTEFTVTSLNLGTPQVIPLQTPGGHVADQRSHPVLHTCAAVVVAPQEGHQVPVQVLPADMVMGPHQNPIQAGPDRVNPAGRDTIDRVLTQGVIDDSVLPSRKVSVASMLVRVNDSPRMGSLSITHTGTGG